MVGILTYNIHSGVGTDGAYDLERVAGVIRRSKAEIACLQEATAVCFVSGICLRYDCRPVTLLAETCSILCFRGVEMPDWDTFS